MELNISERWHHPAHAHGGQCPHQAVPTGAHVGRMSAELAAGRALGGVIVTAWFGIAAHALSVRQFGQLALVLSLGSLVSIGTDLGIPLALTKLSCDHDTLDRGAVMGAVRRRVRAGVVASALLVALWANAGDAARWWLAALYGISVTVTPVTGSFLALLRGRAVGSVEAGYEVASKLALPALALGALAAGLGVGGVLVAYAAVDVASSLVMAQIVRRRLRFSSQPDPEERQALRLRATLPLAAAGIVGSAYERIDIWLLALLKGSASVALYAAAYKLYDAVLLPAKAVGSSSVAAAGRDLAASGRSTARRLSLRAMAITVPIAVVASVVAPTLLRTAFGHQYGKAGNAVVLLMAAAVPGAGLAVVTPLLLLARHRLVVWCTTAGLVANVAANLALVPAVGVTGAALAFLITEAALLLVFWLALPAPAAAAVAPPRVAEAA